MPHSPHKISGRRGGSAPHARRTHWTAGKRRHDPGEDWPIVLAGLGRRLAHPIRGSVSREQLAAAVGVDARTVRRWLAGVDLPPPAKVRAVQAWLARHRTDRREPARFRGKSRSQHLTPKMPLVP